MAPLTGKRVAIIGLGLMGGALAMGLRKLDAHSIAACDTQDEVLQEALDAGIIDWGESAFEGESRILAQSDLVYFCLYPQCAVDFFEAHMADFKTGAVITDITGVKGSLLDQLSGHIRPDIDFIPGHPMAGSEKEGFGGATDAIFAGRNYLLMPGPDNDPAHVEFLESVIRGLGFANIVRTTPEVHDQKIAFTSQLCHVIACALIDSEDDLHITDFEGGSFCDLTRIAMINAPMWTELFLSNKKALLAQIEKFEKALDKTKKQILEDDAEGLYENLQNVRKKRVVMEVDRQNKSHQIETKS